jgi:ubiquinone/menaquinone biosynthesis C-methylase UbiE
MPSEITKHNLDRDKNVLGKDWLSTYGNWFSDEENIRAFVDAVKPILPDHELDILYVASASGLLGESLLKSLGKGNLTIVDISDKHLSENHNPKTKKICADLLEMNLGKKFDLIIMRSALDYFPSPELQVKVLKIIREHMKEGGIFVNQPAYISDLKQRDLISLLYNSIDKIGKRLFQSVDMPFLYEQAGFSLPKKIGESKDMILTEQEHIERYRLDENDIKHAQDILGKSNGCNIKVTDRGYNLRFEFPIFVSK